MFYLTFGFQLLSYLISSATRVLFVIISILSMHQIIVEILQTARIQLLLENGADIFFLIEHAHCKFVRKCICAARITFYQTLLQCNLAQSVSVNVGCIEICKACIDKEVYHL